MKQYHDVLLETRDFGERKSNRTGIDTLMIDGACSRYDLRQGFPAVTTKRLAWKNVKGELCGFLRGFTSAADFRDFGCTVWDQNANENKQWLENPFRKGTDDLGKVYGAQWRDWPGYKELYYNQHINGTLTDKIVANGWECIARSDHRDEDGVSTTYIYHKSIDQLSECVEKIIKDPDNRRILFHGWNPAVLDEIALPSCHLLYQFLPNKDTKEMSLVMYQR